jgi:hypothetical protein
VLYAVGRGITYEQAVALLQSLTSAQAR